MLNCSHEEAAEGRWPLFNVVSSMEQMDVDGYGRIKREVAGLTSGYQHYSIPPGIQADHSLPTSSFNLPPSLSPNAALVSVWGNMCHLVSFQLSCVNTCSLCFFHLGSEKEFLNAPAFLLSNYYQFGVKGETPFD